jgi:hypothetical protein
MVSGEGAQVRDWSLIGEEGAMIQMNKNPLDFN